MKSTMAERKYTKIYFRIFPMKKMLWDYLKILDDHRTIYIRCLQQLAKSKEHMMPTFWTFVLIVGIIYLGDRSRRAKSKTMAC
ncbi:hypothetical protein Zmor_025382 [Zophobas morio]|uniref:Uncharacterized protein n=1 Tax=Zophobas morio TaxID=2755281 RepID=A0AA38HRX4_9CUCU|nr:hypothetical protein Zmor_025382 [Zophobas morio]